MDHIYASDHIFKDFILEKLWVRSAIHMIQGKIGFKVFVKRLGILLSNRMTRIDEIMEFDKNHNIPSTFFFGMDNALGMSYSINKAEPFIKKVVNNGFDAGVHGVDYRTQEGINKEYATFSGISGMSSFGIRNHYVRFNDDTFNKMSKAGYLFDSTDFNKNHIEYKKPYRVGKMWEFPLTIMDGYICFPGKTQEGIENTYKAIEKADRRGLPYCTILFHDYQFEEKYYPDMKLWYEKTIEFCEKKGYEFISYRDAIKELEENE